MVVKAHYSIPVKDEYKEFCIYMGYELLDEKGDFCYFFIPPGHICRFKINYQRWQEGTFNKEKFFESLRRG
ncbi:hypothetical protein N9948_01235 [bacterium]|nr:hypothetical protein [bacterium]